MKVLVTGSRDWNDRDVVRAALKAARATVVIHGAAPGADAEAQAAASELGIADVAHPADWHAHGRAAGPIRNQQMIDAHPDIALCLAFPLATSRGTWDCVNRADKAGIPVRVYGNTGMKRRDTLENRAFWFSVEQAAAEWERTKPAWVSAVEPRT